MADNEFSAERAARILVVEDEALLAAMVEHMLLELGTEVVGVVSSVEEAFQVLETERVNVAILDLSIGEGSAYDAAKLLQERSIPFVFLSSYGDLADCPPEFRRVPWIDKPFVIQDLDRSVRKACPAAR